MPTTTFPTGPFTVTTKTDTGATTTADPTKPFGLEVYSQKPVAVWFTQLNTAIYNLTGTATTTTPWIVHFGATQGDNQVLAEASTDALLGDAGNDQLKGGPGKDVLNGGAGNDAINAADGTKDTVLCGRGKDFVIADRKDKVKKDCERVIRV